jgi:hypothetical protein
MVLHKKNIAEQLERFRHMSGTRVKRMRILKEIRVSNGEQVPLDRIEAEICRAIRYDKEDKMAKIQELLDIGKSINDIGKVMNLPKSKVRRFVKQLRPPEPPPEEASLAPERVTRTKGA